MEAALWIILGLVVIGMFFGIRKATSDVRHTGNVADWLRKASEDLRNRKEK